MPERLELLYRASERMMSVRLENGPTLQISTPVEVVRHLPQTAESTVPGAPLFDVASDGPLLVVRRSPLPRIRRLEVVLDWFSELK